MSEQEIMNENTKSGALRWFVSKVRRYIGGYNY